MPTFSSHCTPVNKPSVNFISVSRRARGCACRGPPSFAHGMARGCTALSGQPLLHCRPGGGVPGDSDGTTAGPGRERRHSGRHRTGATAGQAAQARGAAGPGRWQPASARGNDTTASPGRRLSVRTVIVRTTAAASAVARGTPSRTLPQARAGNNMNAHNLNARARFHCSHPTRRVALAY
jgi:hypothetical protein